MNMSSLIPAYPELVISITTLVVLMADLWVPRERKIVLQWISFAGIALAAAISLALLVDGTRAHAFSNMFVADPLANLLKMGAYLSVATSFIYARRYMADTICSVASTTFSRCSPCWA